ncbi:MAG: serine/threonine protein kinase [Myxococcaceae bacterium]|jgi:tRNA A-37 threonylcarbamoyl transferase component Bud32|nr:serine/threonine protein kinase [Myxococcaceae bacterium]
MPTDSQPGGLADTHLAGGASFAPESLVLGGRFRVERLLGGGGMGLVYLAEQVSLGRKVALKVLRDDLVSTQGMGERFKREALLLSSVEHPAVVRVIDFGEHGASMCLVMEYVEGQSLQQCLEREAPLSVERVERILTQLAQGLAAIHSRGIVHRDLKPDNVVLTKALDGSEQARVLDFGIARLAEPDQRQQVTQVGFVVGTPEYMSPEQAMGQPLDARSDLYALGLIAWRLLTGRAPFPGPSPRELVSQQIHSPPPSLLDAAPHLASAPALVETVMACLQKNPATRPATAQAFLEQLQARPLQLTNTLTGSMRVATAPTRLLAQAKVVPRWKWALGGVTALSLFVAFLVWFLQPARVARRLVDAQRGSEALQVIDDAGGDKASPTLAQLKAAALHQVGRAEEARGLLATIPAEAELEVEALEVLADDYGQLEGSGSEAFKRVRKLLLGWPKARVLKVMQQLATREDGLTQWGALRFVDVEFAGQGLKLTDLYVKALDAKDCTRRRTAARRLGELKATAAVDRLTALKAEPRKRGGMFGLDEDDCGQTAAGEALRRIERGQ